MSDHVSELILSENILKDMGFVLPLTAKILDFGCGAGAAVEAFPDRGYGQVYGYDVENYLSKKHSNDSSHFFFSIEEMATHKGSFDFVFSNQVFEHVMDYPQTIQQIYDLLKPGGISLHYFPSKWRVIEPHIYVPFAGAISSKAYLHFWAKMGVRNEFQGGKSPAAVCEQNYNYCQNNLNYLSSGELYEKFNALFRRVEFREDLFIKHSPGRLRHISKILKYIPGVPYCMRTFHAHTVFLQKPF
ncbi:MAG: methyltransferase domain-containing protein [Alphaproteobacteria bacterium]|jgi:SAM-dependent methyltransferase|nr:methyltransferase domain-containing protein [Alphaproteobacteria bacterium]